MTKLPYPRFLPTFFIRKTLLSTVYDNYSRKEEKNNYHLPYIRVIYKNLSEFSFSLLKMVLRQPLVQLTYDSYHEKVSDSK